MDPTTKTVTPPAPGQVLVPPTQPETDQPAATTQPTFVTLEMAQQLADEAAEKSFKRSQALITNSTQRIREEVNRLKPMIEKTTGAPITPAQEQALEDQVREQVLTEATPPATPGQGQPNAEPLDPVSQYADELMKAEGIVIYETDPEAKDLLKETNPYKFIKEALPAAIAAKRLRTSQAQTAQSKQVIHNPGLGAGGSPPSDVRPGQGLSMISEYYKEKSS
jgi:hypothetical protein